MTVGELRKQIEELSDDALLHITVQPEVAYLLAGETKPHKLLGFMLLGDEYWKVRYYS